MNASNAPLRVLVVDNDADTAESASLLLRLLGHEGRPALSAQAALDLLPDFRPDLLLIDLAMPQVDGCELAARLRTMPDFCAAPLIAVSGFVDASHRQQALDVGFDGFLSKPYTKDDLAELLARTQELAAETRRLASEAREVAAGAWRRVEQSRQNLDAHWLNRRVT